MRHSPVEITKRLLSALDEESNVIDMAVVRDVISILEQLPISTEALEATRLGKHINDLRRQLGAQDASLAKRAKALVRRWRALVIPPQTEPAPVKPAPVRRASPSGASPHSYPSSANTSPCLSRSTTPGLNKLSPGLVRPAPVSPALSARPRPPTAPPATHEVSFSPLQAQPPDKTDVANKRKRKADTAGGGEIRPDKRPRFNGVQDECSRDSISGEINVEVPAALKAPAPAKKPRRSRSALPEVASFDDLSEKVSVARTKRVKTTQELLSDLAERSGDSALARRASQLPASQPPPPPRRDALHDLTRNKSAHIEKFLNSQGTKRRRTPIETIDLEEDEEPGAAAAEEPAAPPEPPPEPPKPWPTEAEILARLPPLDEDAIVWSDDEPAETTPAPRPPLDPARLGGEHLENITGNTNHQGEFREWHQVVTASSCDGGVLPMLPYVIID
ncbi:mediator of RNA polymerase II transcription subunit 26-like [Amphibalanus amphitrite]|uniref:mediator of RNA polymerase II transcription subunit 26-like n=1 Tax=Amphibalanus amphitrite TaxID=1232801 RepID=UPI001C8FDD80|nr:mediator of RNA polymerase II transcription subunit 26-like [Amphibalanus amphitrite]